MLEQRAVKNPSVVLREEFDDWAVLFDSDTGNAVGINPIGVAIWKCLDGDHSPKDIAEELKDIFSDVSETVLEEVKEFLDKLAEGGFAGYEVR
jgi:SynChlorMet cassette protein ScmD